MSSPNHSVALIGLGSIGISFAALHLRFSTSTVKVFDPRPDLRQHLQSVLPGYLLHDHHDDQHHGDADVDALLASGRLVLCDSLERACADVDIIQEQGPEDVNFKQKTWAAVEKIASPRARFWSSTSGIPASTQNRAMSDRSRLLVIHPFNPPHIMPLIEIVPSPDTRSEDVAFAREYFENLGAGHRPVVLNKEIPGFVGNRLAFALLREAIHLVEEDIVSAQDLDTVVEASLGPRWAVQGPFKSYQMGGGRGGIRQFLSNLGGTIQTIWSGLGNVNFQNQEKDTHPTWLSKVIQQTDQAYGATSLSQLAERDAKLRYILKR